MAVKKLKNGRFQADYYEKIPDSKKYVRRKKTVATKDEAIIWEAKSRQKEKRKKNSELRALLRAQDPERRDIFDIIEHFTSSTKFKSGRESTQRRNIRLVNHFRDWCEQNNHSRIEFLSTDTAEEYEKWVYAHFKNKGVNHCLGIAKAIFESEKRRYGSLLKENPFFYTHRLKIDRTDPRFFTIEELRMIFSVCDEFQRHAFNFLLKTGLRTMEALSLPPERVKATGIKIAPYAGWKPKSFKSNRIVPYGTSAKEHIDYFTAKNGGKRFLLTGDAVVREDYLYKRFNGIKRRVKKKYNYDLTGTHVHTFRKTYGSILVQQGAKMLAVSNLMGHESILTTERLYAGLIPSDLEKDALRMDSFVF